MNKIINVLKNMGVGLLILLGIGLFFVGIYLITLLPKIISIILIVILALLIVYLFGYMIRDK